MFTTSTHSLKALYFEYQYETYIFHIIKLFCNTTDI